MRFTDQLRNDAAEIWDAQYKHPFIRGIADGSLADERFRVYVRQDYLFLIEYARLLALACARAPELELMKRFAELTHAILWTEMELHRDYAAQWGISREELERESPHPATRAYTDFLLRIAALGDFAELIAALLPCMWGYSEIGQRLARDTRGADARFASWIEMYSSDEFAALADWCRQMCEQAAAEVGPDTRRRMRDAFLTSSRHELAFWESAWRAET